MDDVTAAQTTIALVAAVLIGARLPFGTAPGEAESDVVIDWAVHLAEHIVEAAIKITE
jgi:hypothetical protein